jgi:hypothetical protein
MAVRRKFKQAGGVDVMDKRTILMPIAMVALLAFGQAQAGVVEDYNAKPLASGRDSHDSRLQDRTRHSSDPEVVLGRDWRRSFWAFSPAFAKLLVAPGETRPPQPPYLSVENLPPGLEAIELRVSWDAKEDLYRCSYHLFIAPAVPIPTEAEHVPGVGTTPLLPPGIGLRQPLPMGQGLWFGNVAIVASMHQMLSLAPMLDSLRRNSLGGTTYATFYQGSCAALAHSSAERRLEVGIVIDPKQPYTGPTRQVSNRTYATFAVPTSVIRIGAPYFRRAEKINRCYLNERRPREAIVRESTQFRVERERECIQLRTLPIDSTEKPFDLK